MDNPAIIAERIKDVAAQKNVRLKDMLSALNLNVAYIAQMRLLKNPPIDKIGLIAEYLGVSTDYLLGAEPVAPAPAEEVDPRYIRLVNAVRKMTPEQVEAWLALLEHQQAGQ